MLCTMLQIKPQVTHHVCYIIKDIKYQHDRALKLSLNEDEASATRLSVEKYHDTFKFSKTPQFSAPARRAKLSKTVSQNLLGLCDLYCQLKKIRDKVRIVGRLRQAGWCREIPVHIISGCKQNPSTLSTASWQTRRLAFKWK